MLFMNKTKQEYICYFSDTNKINWIEGEKIWNKHVDKLI